MVIAIACLMLAPAMWAAALLSLAVAGDLGSISAKRLLGRLDRQLTKTAMFPPHRMIASPGGAIQPMTRLQD